MTDINTPAYFDSLAKTWDEDPQRLARAKAVASGITKRIKISSFYNCLEYGCGTGLLSFLLHPHLKNILLADSSEGMLTVLRKKISDEKVLNMSVAKLDLQTDDFKPAQFDFIYSMMVLHHIENTDHILANFFSLLKVNSYLCLADLDTEDGTFHGPEFRGHKGFDRLVLKKKIERAGFVDISFETTFSMTNTSLVGQLEYPIFLMIAKKN